MNESIINQNKNQKNTPNPDQMKGITNPDQPSTSNIDGQLAGADPFKKSTTTQRSPNSSTRAIEVFHTPLSSHPGETSKRKRTVGESPGTKAPKVACVDPLAKLERTIEKLCKSVADSSNTKKEIRDLSAALRNQVARMIHERNKDKTLMIEQTTQDRATHNYQLGEEKGTEDTRDEYTQTERSTRQPVHQINEIHQMLQNEDNADKLVEMMTLNWPSDAYVKTTTTTNDFLAEVGKKNAIIAIEVPIDKTPSAENQPPEIARLLGKKQLRNGETIHIKSRTRWIKTSPGIEEPDINTYILAIDPTSDRTKTTKDILKILESNLKEAIDPNLTNEEKGSYLFGSTSRKLGIVMRKVLELFGQKKDAKFNLHIPPHQTKKKKKPAEKGIENNNTNKVPISYKEALQQPKWEVQRRRKAKFNTVTITPSDTSTLDYGEMLKSLKKDIDIKQLGIQVHRVQNTRNGQINIQFTGKEENSAMFFQQELASKVKETASAKLLEKTEVVVLRDLEPDVEELEIKEAIEAIIGKPVSIDTKIMESANSRGLKLAFITLPAEHSTKLVELRRLHIGWSRCRIEPKISLTRCYKCLRFGHVAARCSTETENAKRCFKCGESNHLAKECQSLVMCLECKVPGHRMDSMACPVYAKMINEVRSSNKRGPNKIKISKSENGTENTTN